MKSDSDVVLIRHFKGYVRQVGQDKLFHLSVEKPVESLIDFLIERRPLKDLEHELLPLEPTEKPAHHLILTDHLIRPV